MGSALCLRSFVAARSSRRIPHAASARCGGPSSPPPQPTPANVICRRSLLSVAPGLLCCGCGCGGVRGPACKPRNAGLDALFAQSMATGMQEYEHSIAPVKRRLFSQLAPVGPAAGNLEVLELGAGTGPNLGYYSPESTRITAVDPNAAMEIYLRENAERLGWVWGEGGVRAVPGVAEALPLPDSCMDAVVCTLVLCSVPDVEAALREAVRVLRPGGRLLFIEHTRAPAPGALALGQWAFDPLQQWLADGCHLRRDPLPAVERAGFGSVQAERFTVEGMGLIGPHVAGIAVL